MPAIYDGQWKLFSHEPSTGRTVWVIEDGGKMHFRIDYPVDAVLAANHDARAASAGTRFGDMARIASIPLNVFHGQGVSDALQQDDQKWLSRWLNDGDNRAWRTRDGSV